jgi:hypothetical protein
MNFEHVGEPLAIIVGKDNKVKNPKVLYVSDNKDGSVHHSFNSLVVQEGEKFQPIPNTKKERAVLYVTGSSGSGKSYYTANYVSEFKRIYPKRDVYLISSLNDDSSIDRIPGLKRIKLNDEFLNTELSAEDFTKSLVIFDDTDCLTNKPMKLKVNGLLNSLLETGRHSQTFVVYTSHLATAGNDTKRILNESHAITFFPASMGGRSLKYLLESYLGLDKCQIKKVKSLKSRWVTIFKSYPQIVISEKEVYTISNSNE